MYENSAILNLIGNLLNSLGGFAFDNFQVILISVVPYAIGVMVLFALFIVLKRIVFYSSMPIDFHNSKMDIDNIYGNDILEWGSSEQIAEYMGGWASGDKEKFDRAYSNKDEVVMSEMLNSGRVPQSYRERFNL